MAGDVCPLRLDEDAYYDLSHLRMCTRRHIASQEHPMTSPTQRRHDEILGRLDALIDAVQSTTARDNLHRLLAEESAAERRDEPVDTAPDVDPDEALAAVLYARRLGLPETELPPDSTTRDAYLEMARAAREHIYAEPDQSWVTRDLDEAEQRAIDAEARATQAEAARDREANRYEELRADVEWVAKEAAGHSERLRNMGGDVEHRGCAHHAKRELQSILDSDDERGRDA